MSNSSFGRRDLLMGLGMASLGLTAACGKETNTIVQAGIGKEASAAAIDADPWALLPAGPIAWGHLAAPELFASRFGPTLLNLVTRRIPALQDAGFDARRDISEVNLGVYSIQGADVVGVATGNFDPARIEASVEKNPVTPFGIAMTKTRYGGRTLFMAESSGFTALTAHTALFGNQMGMRRAIDRINSGKLERRLPAWLEAQLKGNNAPIVLGINLKENPFSEATHQQLPFLNGMQTLGVLANFQDPGVNLAGTATYPDANAARTGADTMKQLNDYLQSMGWVMALFGIAQPLRSLTTEAAGSEVRFVAQVDGVAADRLLGQLDMILPGGGTSSSTAPSSRTRQSEPRGLSGVALR